MSKIKLNNSIYLRKLFLIFLLIVFFFNIGGYYVPFLVIRFAIREKMDEQIKENNSSQNELTKLIFNRTDNSNQLVWTKDGKEFSYKDEMYDVVKIKHEKDKIIYFCIKDKAENNLLESFVSLIKKNFGNDKKNRFDFSKELSKYDLTVKNNLINVQLLNTLHPSIVSFYQNLHMRINVPPPKFI